jgi:hypothetical protein
MEAEREKATEQELEWINEDDESEQLERTDAEGDRTDNGAAREGRQEMSNKQQRKELGDREESPPEAVGEEMDE